MKLILQHVFQKKREYSRLPLFGHIRDERLDPLDRLAFYPGMAFFILAFGDLNRFVLRFEQPKSVYEEMVNVHTFEDDHHWPWYLEDLTKLGFDHVGPASDAWRALWGEETKKNRLLMYGLTALIEGASAVERLAIIEAIEETGNVIFSAMLPAAKELEQRLGVELRYCGAYHFEKESGHTVGADHKQLASIELDEAGRERCMNLVDKVFELFTPFTYELLRYAKENPVDRSATPKAPLVMEIEDQL